MVGIYGIGGIPEPANAAQVGTQPNKKEAPKAAAAQQDGVTLSTEALSTAKAVQLSQESEQQARLQAERVARAKERIEQGTYRVQSVVLLVAARITRAMGTEIS